MTMTREEIAALFERRHAAWQRRDTAALAGLHASMGVVESPTAGGSVTGRAAIGQVYETWFAAFPDGAYTPEELLIDGDRVVQIATLSGTDTGGFLGLPATGKPFRVPVVMLCTLQDHQIVYERRIYDFTGMLIQIGVLKAKPA
jgi:steroid delta-isomerase-like uncharacterized protein